MSSLAWSLCVHSLLLGAGTQADPSPVDKLAAQKASAKAMVEALVKQDYKAASQDFDDVMRKALPSDKLEATWKSILGSVGAVKKQLPLRTESGKYDIVFVPCEFEKAKLDIKI